MNLKNLVSPRAVAALKTAGLHNVVGEMTGGGEMTAAKAAGLIGASAFMRRKSAKLIVDGLLSLAAVEKTAVSGGTVDHLRAVISPARGQ
jgi:hypothetical protein